MFAEIFDARAWLDWFGSLDRGFLFLLLLPFVVAVVGVWGSYRHDEDVVARRDDTEDEA